MWVGRGPASNPKEDNERVFFTDCHSSNKANIFDEIIENVEYMTWGAAKIERYCFCLYDDDKTQRDRVIKIYNFKD